MKKPTTIAEATARCERGFCGDKRQIGGALPYRDCPQCNGTGYACGVKPTEVEQALFDILKSTKVLNTLLERPVDSSVRVEMECHFFENLGVTGHVGLWLDNAEAYALSLREGP